MKEKAYKDLIKKHKRLGNIYLGLTILCLIVGMTVMVTWHLFNEFSVAIAFTIVLTIATGQALLLNVYEQNRTVEKYSELLQLTEALKNYENSRQD